MFIFHQALHDQMKKKDKEQDFQAIMDLVAVHTITNVFLRQQTTEQTEEEASHQSDSFDYDDLGEHHSDQPVTIFNKVVSPTLGWKLAQIIKHFFSLK